MTYFNKIANFENSNSFCSNFSGQHKTYSSLEKKSHEKDFKQRASIIIIFFKLGEERKINIYLNHGNYLGILASFTSSISMQKEFLELLIENGKILSKNEDIAEKLNNVLMKSLIHLILTRASLKVLPITVSAQ